MPNKTYGLPLSAEIDERPILFEILLIDGDRERRSRVAQQIEGVSGLVLTQAGAEIDAIRLAKEDNPSLVLVGIDGLDSWLLAVLRGALGQTPILPYTTTWDPASEWRALQAGARGLLSASDTKATFLTAILEALRAVA
jgi:DNA-binding NarL/FixJ family response regulator